MSLDPQLRKVLAASAMAPAADGLTPVEMREMYARMRLGPIVDDELATQDVDVPGPDGAVPVRIYEPPRVRPSGPRRTIVFFHGGGFVVGSIETHDAVCRALAARTGSVVVSVEYRLAPEHPFPAAADDCLAAAGWTVENAPVWGGDEAGVWVAGDSAGGNLAASVTITARDRGGPAFAGQLLVYPVTDRDFGTGSYRTNGDGYLLTRRELEWFWEHYHPAARPPPGPRATPLRAETLAGLPPAIVYTADLDPLRDEGLAYAERLAAAGTHVIARNYEGLIHGFLSLAPILDRGRAAFDDIARDLEAIEGALSCAPTSPDAAGQP